MHPSSPHESAACLDMIHVTWLDDDGEQSDESILLEVSAHGGLLHASAKIPAGQAFRVEKGAHHFPARARSCHFDGYGYVVRFSVTSARWYPRHFEPENLRVPATRRKRTSHAA